MPVPKRYFHVSQELNHDPELWTFTDKFGDRSIRTWLQILAYLDRSENRWRLCEGSFKSLGRLTRQYDKNVRLQVEEMVKTGWLQVLESDSNGSPLVLSARNWTKYNRSKEHRGNTKTPNSGTPREPKDTPSVPTPTPLPSPTPKEEEKIVKQVARSRRLSDEEFLSKLRKSPAYQHLNLDIELEKMDIWLLANPGRVKNRKFILNWLNKDRPVATPKREPIRHRTVQL